MARHGDGGKNRPRQEVNEREKRGDTRRRGAAAIHERLFAAGCLWDRPGPGRIRNLGSALVDGAAFGGREWGAKIWIPIGVEKGLDAIMRGLGPGVGGAEGEQGSTSGRGWQRDGGIRPWLLQGQGAFSEAVVKEAKGGLGKETVVKQKRKQKKKMMMMKQKCEERNKLWWAMIKQNLVQQRCLRLS